MDKLFWKTESAKIILPSLLSVILFSVAIFWVFLPYVEKSQMQRKQEEIQDLTRATLGVVRHFYRLEQRGVLTRKQAQTQAISLIRGVRYGKQGKDYFWINDMHPFMVMHPYRTDLDGKDLSGFKDQNGQHLFVDFVRVVRERGSGYVGYLWQWKDDPGRIVPKLSFVMGFKPWGWVIGTGIYLQDVEEEIGAITRYLSYISLGILLAIIMLSAYIVNQSVRTAQKRRLAESALYESKEEFRAILESSPDPVAVYDQEGRCTYVSPSFVDTFGWEMKELIGKRIPFVPEDEIQITMDNIEELYRGGKQVSFQTQRLTKSGEKLDIIISAASIGKQAGSTTGMVVHLTDITTRRKLEEQLSHARKMEAVGVLAGGVAHDFNNILHIISGYVELAKTEEDHSPQLEECLSGVDKAAQRAAGLVKRLLAFSRRASLEMKPIDLNAEILMVVGILERTMPKMISISTDLADNLLKFNGDPSQLEQVLMNLGNNSGDAMPGGGALTMATRNIRVDEANNADYPMLQSGEYVELTVSDNGQGIPPDIQEHIFEPFFTTKEVGQGTGLGLSSVYGIVQSHRGQIICKSEPGRGTAFILYFPALSPGAAEENTGADTDCEQVLLIMDNEENMLKAKSYLDQMGHKMVIARDFAAGDKILVECRGRVNLIICEVKAPEAELQVFLERAGEALPEASVLFFGDHLHMEGIARAGASGNLKAIPRPFTLEKLAAGLHKVRGD